MDDPPKGWAAMLELMAVADPEPPPKAGFFERLLIGSLGRAQMRAERDFIRLGLKTTQSPRQERVSYSNVPRFSGPTVVEGERNGRAVEIRMDPDRYRTKLAAPVPELHVHSKDGRLAASERAPREVHDALATLSEDDRWEGLEVKGGPDGIAVYQHFKGGRSSESGYLDGLWLAEALADRLGSPGGGPAQAP